MRDDDKFAEIQTEADDTGADAGGAEDLEATGVQDDVDSQQHGEAVASLRELVVFLVESLIDDPEQAEVVADQRGSLVQIQVRLPESELGKVIGRGGRIAKSIRTALMIAGSRHHLRVSLDIES